MLNAEVLKKFHLAGFYRKVTYLTWHDDHMEKSLKMILGFILSHKVNLLFIFNKP